MLTVLLVVQIIIAVALVGVILIQRNSGDGLSGLGGGGGANSLLSGRASANILTRITAILAAAFMINSLAMATIISRSAGVVDGIENLEKSPAAVEIPDSKGESGAVVPEAPAESEQKPSVPIAE